MKLYAIKEHHLYNKAFTKGERAVGKLVAVYVLKDYAARRLRDANPMKQYLNRVGLSVGKKIADAHEHGKAVFVHIDLMKGIGKDKCGVEFLAKCGADGIISTRASLIKAAKEIGVLTAQRYFALDSQGLESIKEMIASARPDFVEIMPGVIEKVIKKFADFEIPIIAGGLLETKAEVTAALSSGALAISTGKKELWYS